MCFSYDGTVELHLDPAGNRYLAVASHGPDAVLRPRAVADIEVRVADLIP